MHSSNKPLLEKITLFIAGESLGVDDAGGENLLRPGRGLPGMVARWLLQAF